MIDITFNYDDNCSIGWFVAYISTECHDLTLFVFLEFNSL